MYVNIQQATKLTGKSRATITRHINSGKLSKTDAGIDTAELLRVYGALVTISDESVNHSSSESVATREQWLMSHIDALQRQLVAQQAQFAERERRLMQLLTHDRPDQAKTGIKQL